MSEDSEERAKLSQELKETKSKAEKSVNIEIAKIRPVACWAGSAILSGLISPLRLSAHIVAWLVFVLFDKSQVKFICSTFHVQNNSKCFTEIKALQQGAEKALKICKIIERIADCWGFSQSLHSF